MFHRRAVPGVDDADDADHPGGGIDHPGGVAAEFRPVLRHGNCNDDGDSGGPGEGIPVGAASGIAEHLQGVFRSRFSDSGYRE